jgi:hypothetical protein
MEPVMMADRITSKNVEIDAPTSRAVANGIGEKLQQTLGTEQRFPEQLQKLLEQLHDREAGNGSKIKGR